MQHEREVKRLYTDSNGERKEAIVRDKTGTKSMTELQKEVERKIDKNNGKGFGAYQNKFI